MLRAAALAISIVLLFASAASGQVPQTISYQGVLTDAAGVPLADGNYSLTFRLYDAATGGALLWSETQPAVPLSRGGFGVLLGAVSPLTLAFDKPCWLGVAVGASAELSPRVAIAAAPYALGLRLPFSGAANSALPAMRLSNGGSGPDLMLDHRLQIGALTPAIRLALFPGYGGVADVMDESGVGVGGLEADVNGEGGFLYVTGNAAGSNFFYVDGNSDGLGNPRVDLVGAASAVTFNTAVAGDASVVLPAGAIDAAEILDEPGIAQAHSAGAAVVPGNGPAMSNVIAVTIATPAAGYVVVRAQATHQLAGDGTNPNYLTLQISENSAGAPEAGELAYSGYALNAPAASAYVPLTIERTYYKPAGSWTFYFEALTTAGGTSSSQLLSPMISATYYPTSYGPVVVAAAAAAPGIGPAAPVVDLRTLEREAARERAALDATERRIAAERLKRQLGGHP